MRAAIFVILFSSLCLAEESFLAVTCPSENLKQGLLIQVRTSDNGQKAEEIVVYNADPGLELVGALKVEKYYFMPSRTAGGAYTFHLEGNRLVQIGAESWFLLKSSSRTQEIRQRCTLDFSSLGRLQNTR